MAVPKRKVSHSRKAIRRGQCWKLTAPSFSTCPNCGSLKTPHRVCRNCGFYKGREVVQMDED